MRKMIFTLFLAITSSVWTMSSALCIARAPQMQQSTETLSGYFVMEGTPCESTVEPCLPCLTLAFQSNETLYYLTSDNDQMMSQLDEIEAQILENMPATVTGIVYQQGNYHYINVQSISLNNDPLPSLCDEWNVLVPGFSWPYTDFTYMHRLTSDTLINGQSYVQLESNESGSFVYEGAMRESNSKIYYIPAGSTHEYLLYDFNVQIGDTLTNLWIGGQESEYELGLIRDIIVEDIKGTAPSRKFYMSFTYDYWQGMFSWIEGVGLNEGPAGWYYVPGTPVDPTPEILCAYKDRKRVYATSQAEQYSCCYNTQKINSLCDTWNVMAHLMALGPEYESFSTHHYRLTHDTIINNTSYVALEKEGQYVGAMREENNARIYYYPANATHEYLLYAFDAKVGDSFENVWFGGSPQQFPNGSRATVREIQETTPRVMWLGVEYSLEGIDEIHTCTHYYWIDGVGLFVGPCGEDCPFDCGGGPAFSVLCAYKNGEQVYAAPLSKELGCEYNYTPNKTPTDTIPLYTQDDPGSSTVDPVDPNQVVATLQGNQLTIHENMGVDITYSLQNNAPAQTPSQHRAPQSDTFRNEVTVQITESGEYLLQLTNPSWGYTIFGKFTYVAEGIDNVDSSSQREKGQLILQDGQLFILRGDKTYTLTGQEVR